MADVTPPKTFDTHSVSAYMLIAGGATKIPIVGMQLLFPLNGVPTVMVRPGRGVPLMKIIENKYSAGTPGLKPPQEGQTLVIKLIYDGAEYTAFDGFISGISGSRVNQGAAASASLVVNGIHRLGILGGLPPASRILTKGSPRDLFDLYNNEKYLSSFLSKADTFIAQLTDKNFDMGTDEFIRELFKVFYESETMLDTNGTKGEANRAVDTDSMSVLHDMLAIFDLKYPTQLQSGSVMFRQNLVSGLVQSWKNRTGLDVLMGILNDQYCSISAAGSNIYIIPDFSSVNTPMVSVAAESLFGLDRSMQIDPRATTAVAMNFSIPSSDTTNIRTNAITPYVYPPEARIKAGQIIYIDPPWWARPYFSSKTGDHAASSPLPNVACAEVPENIKSATEKAKDTPKADDILKQWGNIIVAAEYGQRLWRKERMTISLPFNTSVVPGKLVEVTSKDKTNMFGATVLYGMVDAVAIELNYGSFIMNASLSSVRTKESNDAHGFAKHPFYQNADITKSDAMLLMV